MDDDLLSIGALSRAGGLPVTALRYYDAAGVLRPAHVDPVTGYRWYTAAQAHTARLVASLRRAGLPVPEMAAVLAAPERADEVLDRHRRRLVDDLLAAQAHLDDAAGLLAAPARCTVPADALVGAVRAVRHAVGAADPRWPGLAGVLVHLDGEVLRLVGCDRSRLAVATIPVAEPSGPPTRVLAPAAFLDALTTATVPAVGTVTLGPHHLEAFGRTAATSHDAYPDYERLLPARRDPAATVAAGALTAAVAGAGDVVVVRLDGGRVELAAPGPGDTLGYARSFLLDAVRAARSEHVALSLDDERAALGVRPAGRPDDVGLVMPVLLHH